MPCSDSEHPLCCHCNSHPQYHTETTPPDLCRYHWYQVIAEDMQASKDRCRSTQKGYTMSAKKPYKLNIKSELLWVPFQLCCMLHFLSSVLAPTVAVLDQQSTICNGLHLYLGCQTQNRQRGGRYPIFYTLLPELAGGSWAKQQEGGLLSCFQTCPLRRQKISVNGGVSLPLVERVTFSHFHFYELTA